MLDVDFQEKVTRAKKVEKEICKWIQESLDYTAHRPPQFTPEYDIVGDKIGKVEVKEDNLAHITNNYAIEYENFKGEPSGLAATRSDLFVLVDHDQVCIIASQALRDIVESYPFKKLICMGGERCGGGRVRGYLIPREIVLAHPLANVKSRWFSTWEGMGV